MRHAQQSDDALPRLSTSPSADSFVVNRSSVHAALTSCRSRTLRSTSGVWNRFMTKRVPSTLRRTRWTTAYAPRPSGRMSSNWSISHYRSERSTRFGRVLER